MDISNYNSWWFSGGLWQDPDLLRVKNSFLTYHPSPIGVNECSSQSVLTLRGPRRAGKTVALKLLVAELIEKHDWDPKKIVWMNFDTLRTLSQAETQLRDAVTKFNPKLLLIDEVTSLPSWQKVIKKLRDEGPLAQVTVLLTGSSARDLKSGAERMAGRRGDIEHPDRVLLPISFLDFCNQLQHANLQLSHEELTKTYLDVGGFPFRLDAWIKTQKSQDSWDKLKGFQVFDDVIFYEFTRRKLDRNIALEVLHRLSQIKANAISFEGFAKPLTISRDTAKKYIAALGDAFLLATISSFDLSKQRVALKKDKKLMWIDPALGFIAEWLGQGDPADEASRAEWAVGAELIRQYERRVWEGLSAPRNVFTWKSSGGNEVDFLVVDITKKTLLPVEVKFQSSISDWDFQVMERAFKKGVLVTKQTEKIRPLSRGVSLVRFLTEIGLETT